MSDALKLGFGLAFALATGACTAATQPPLAPQPVQERWQRIMAQMRADSAEAAHAATRLADEAPAANASGSDGAMPAGIDISTFEIPIQYNERVQFYIDLYAQRRRSVFAGWYQRMGRYREYVEQRLAEYGLPKELVYLAMIESGFETGATSSAAAVGVWQFMTPTARAEGLEVSDFVDERRDPFRSTDAAVRHLSGLYQTFGSWYLAAAAYNSGATRIARLMKESYGRIKGPDETFWEIQDAVPQETRGYVPGLIAATIIGEYPELFGFDAIRQDDPVRFETVRVPGATDLRAVARAAGVAPDAVNALNSHLIRGMTPPDRTTEVRVPVGSSAGFHAAFSEIPALERVRIFARTHTVQAGETLSGIARRYGTTVDALQKANRIQRPSVVSVGRKLTIPGDVPREAYGTD